MAEEWKEYVDDPRMVCKYASKCYQRNPEHHKKFKHPPQTNRKAVNRNKRRFSPYNNDSPRHSSNTLDKDKSPSRDITEKTAGNVKNDLKKDQVEIKNVQDLSFKFDQDDTKCEDTKDHVEDDIKSDTESRSDAQPSVDLPKNVTFFDQNTDHNIFKELFLVEMPEDFFKFYECISDYSGSVEKTLASVNLMAVGPYELLLGKLPKLDNKELYLIHWRFFYDPPEFQTLLRKKNGENEFHIGYFRDDPEQKPAFVGSNNSAKDCVITPMAWNIFGAVYLYLKNETKKSPFNAVACQKLMHAIKSYAEKNNISLEEFNKKKRVLHTVARSLHGAGIVVPYDKKTQLGYRQIETDANLKKMFAALENATNQSEKNKILSELQPVITYASIAVDECDFGTGVEIGIALFCSGIKELEPSALSNLTAAYTLLRRTAFAQIIQAHLKHRRKGPNMSVLDLKGK